jgi:hypothetical protein
VNHILNEEQQVYLTIKTKGLQSMLSWSFSMNSGKSRSRWDFTISGNNFFLEIPRGLFYL